MASIIGPSFYRRDDVVRIGRELIGQRLCSSIDGVLTSGIIVETEAYSHLEKACHTYGGKRSPRTEIFYNDGGLSYVYLCYGIHHLFNIITNDAEGADAVLIRAIAPIDGMELMMQRRKMTKPEYRMTAGPGSVSTALGIGRGHNGLDVTSGELIWVERERNQIQEDQIIASPRVGVGYAGEDALLPWRFRLKDSPWTSKAK